MRILFAGNKDRGLACLRAVLGAGHSVVAVLAHASPEGGFAAAAEELGLPMFRPADVNDPALHARLRELSPEVTVLAGYGPIVGKGFIGIAPRGCINLHGGRVPEYRGSSPMNWALINGESEFTLSVLRVNERIDAGDVLCERTFPIRADDTIAELQDCANRAFPEMLVETLARLQAGTLTPRSQDESRSAYHPLRFPEDGLVVWDQLTAQAVHNRVRALADPYPNAFTFWKGRRIDLKRSCFTDRPFHGEPGRVYRKGKDGLLVCAADRCLWISKAVFAGGGDACVEVPVYGRLATMRGLILDANVPEGRA